MIAGKLANNRGFNIDYHFTQGLDYVDDAYSFGTQALVKRDTSTVLTEWVGQHGSSTALFFVLPAIAHRENLLPVLTAEMEF